MNIRKFAKRYIFQAPSDGEGSGAGMDQNQATNAFASLLNPEAAPAAAEPAKVAPAAPAAPDAAGEDESEEDVAARLAAEGEPGENEQEEGNDDDGMLTIQVDGKDVQVKKSELPELYKNGMRQADYTRKTMEAAEARKTAETETQQARAQRAQYAQELSNYVITSESILREQERVLTQELLHSDPVEYLSQQRIFQARQAEMAKAQQDLQNLQTQHQQEQAEEVKAYTRQQLELLHAKLPEWKDPAKFKADAEKLTAHMRENGFNDQEIGSIVDHRVMLMMRKAMQYDSLMARAKDATSKVAKAPSMVERPGAGNKNTPTDGRTADLRNLAKSGSVDAAAKAFLHFLN